MKKKFIIFTLCFTLIFSSINFKKSYADGGVISLPILATVSALAVGTGIVISSNDDLYDIGRIFYDYIDRHNDLTWSTVQSIFTASVSLQPNKLVSVKSDFLDIVKGFFDDLTLSYNGSFDYSDISFLHGMPIYEEVVSFVDYPVPYVAKTFEFSYLGNGLISLPNGKTFQYNSTISSYKFLGFNIYSTGHIRTVWKKRDNYYLYGLGHYSEFSTSSGTVVSLPYNGGYTWDNVESKKENESIALPIPGDLSSLVGQGSKEFWDNTDNLINNGVVSLPNVGNPSIDLDTSISFPSVDTDVPGVGSPSVPNEGIWSTIKDFIIGLVVPSDSFWTDTWGGLYNNFTNSFPMVDMDGFNDLVTGEKKFPNIDINIMGVNGRVVNGDVINSIVDWLRPIIAGFMMLCLMLFNYRKIYKLIRNSEPFGGIASGTSDFSTGISEYSKQEVVKATDMVAEYRSWKERGGK